MTESFPIDYHLEILFEFRGKQTRRFAFAFLILHFDYD